MRRTRGTEARSDRPLPCRQRPAGRRRLPLGGCPTVVPTGVLRPGAQVAEDSSVRGVPTRPRVRPRPVHPYPDGSRDAPLPPPGVTGQRQPSTLRRTGRRPPVLLPPGNRRTGLRHGDGLPPHHHRSADRSRRRPPTRRRPGYPAHPGGPAGPGAARRGSRPGPRPRPSVLHRHPLPGVRHRPAVPGHARAVPRRLRAPPGPGRPLRRRTPPPRAPPPSRSPWAPRSACSATCRGGRAPPRCGSCPSSACARSAGPPGTTVLPGGPSACSSPWAWSSTPWATRSPPPACHWPGRSGSTAAAGRCSEPSLDAFPYRDPAGEGGHGGVPGRRRRRGLCPPHPTGVTSP